MHFQPSAEAIKLKEQAEQMLREASDLILDQKILFEQKLQSEGWVLFEKEYADYGYGYEDYGFRFLVHPDWVSKCECDYASWTPSSDGVPEEFFWDLG